MRLDQPNAYNGPIIEVSWIDCNGDRHNADERTAIVRFRHQTLFVCTGDTPELAIEKARRAAYQLAQDLMNIEVA